MQRGGRVFSIHPERRRLGCGSCDFRAKTGDLRVRNQDVDGLLLHVLVAVERQLQGDTGRGQATVSTPDVSCKGTWIAQRK